MCKKRYIIFSKYLIILLVILTSCSNRIEIEEPTLVPSLLMDRSWLADDPCKAPCWYGLEPGKSTKEESISTVKMLPFINPESMIEEDTSFWDDAEPEGIPGQMIWFEYKENPQVNCIYMQIERDILAWFLLTPLNISFKHIVDSIGPPDFFTYSQIYPEGKGCDVSLLWVERQIEVTHIEEKRGMFGKDLCNRIQEAENKMLPELSVFQVLYMQKDWVEEKTSEKKYNPWNGFITPSP